MAKFLKPLNCIDNECATYVIADLLLKCLNKSVEKSTRENRISYLV